MGFALLNPSYVLHASLYVLLNRAPRLRRGCRNL